MLQNGLLQTALGMLRCPGCRGTEATLAPDRKGGELFISCRSCNASYPVKEGIVDFIPHYRQPQGKGLAQRMMENRLVVSVYENHFRPAFTRLGSPITYEEEIEWLKSITTEIEVDTILDLACGTGKYSRLLNDLYKPKILFAVDISTPMLQKAVEYAQREGISNIIHIRADAASLPFGDAAIARVNCFGALHLFPDLLGALEEIGRVSKDGAVFTCLTSRKVKGLLRPGQLIFSKLLSFRFFDEERLKEELEKAGFLDMRSVRNKMVLMFRCEKTNRPL